MDGVKFSAELSKVMKIAGIKTDQNKAKKFLIALSKALTEGLSKDREITLSNLGTFSVKKFGAKIINSPRGDGRKFFMPPTDIIKWIPSGKIRVRAESQAISIDDWQKLVGNGDFEELDEKDEIETKGEASVSENFVKINYSKPDKFLSDESSPISKFVRKIFIEAKNNGAKKIEICPNKNYSYIIFQNNGKDIAKKKIIKDSHTVIISKIKKSENEQFKISTKLSPYGEILILTAK